MRHEQLSALKMGNPPLMTSLALHSQQEPSLQAGTRAVITGGETATQILSDETSGSDDVAPSVHFRGILTIGITGIIIIIIIIIRVMIMMMSVVEMVDW